MGKGAIQNDEIWVVPYLGETKETPFVYKNYRLHVKKTGENLYEVRLKLELKADRIGGTYPITWEVTGKSQDGKEIEQKFITYAIINQQETSLQQNNGGIEDMNIIPETGAFASDEESVPGIEKTEVLPASSYQNRI